MIAHGIKLRIDVFHVQCHGVHGSLPDSRELSCLLLELSIPANQVVRRAVVLQGGLGCAFEFRNDALRENLAEFHAPLVKRVDLPDRALREDAVLVERNQSCRGLQA